MQSQQQDNLTIDRFEKLSDEEIKQYVNKNEKSDLAELLILIKKKRAVCWEDRAILQMVEKSPLTFWASNKAYTVVLWSGTCKETYRRDLLGKPFPEIMSVFERSQAMTDSLSVIEADENKLEPLLADFKNYYTKDLQGSRAADFSLVTNSMQLINDETGEKYYAEIGLPIDLEKALEVHQERQREFDERVNTFKTDVASLRSRFTADINALRTRLNNEFGLSSKQKKDLRKRLDDEKVCITANLDKSERAFDFAQFLQDNEDAIVSSIQKLSYEIENATNKVATVSESEQQENPETLKVDIEHKKELVQTTFDSEIRKKTSANIIDDAVDKQRSEQIVIFQNRRDEFIRRLTNMRESVDQSTSYALTLFRKELSTIESEMRIFIDDVNKTEAKTKNGKKK
ncbi:hypothetical protein FACS1894217_05530 [Clostridia bacterium]|nr:hypothetical protein FACS1894217_05530 [Clostridia bacterium]